MCHYGGTYPPWIDLRSPQNEEFPIIRFRDLRKFSWYPTMVVLIRLGSTWTPANLWISKACVLDLIYKKLLRGSQPQTKVGGGGERSGAVAEAVSMLRTPFFEPAWVYKVQNIRLGATTWNTQLAKWIRINGMPLWWYLSALDRFEIPAKWWISKMQISRFAEF